MRGVLLLLVMLPGSLLAQTGPFLAWTQTATGSTAAQVSTWQWELWVNGTGQLPLLTAPCTGPGPDFTCQVPYASLPMAARMEGMQTLALVAVAPTGLKSQTSAPFPVVVPAAPSNLRLVP
jgi:hypothetical protein